jgi:Mlc titration factor MtfA (ptsG expression regulator)
MNHLKKELLAKKEESNMEQVITKKAEKVKGEAKQKGKVVLKWILIATYSVLVIYFVFKPLTEFVVMLDYYIKSNIVNYFIK